MKVIIAGSRSITDANVLLKAVAEADFDITEVVSGGAKGVDRLGELYAKLKGITVKQFLPAWGGYAGNRAGHVRNGQMAQYADALIAITTGPESKGTAHMIHMAKERGLKTFVYTVTPTIAPLIELTYSSEGIWRAAIKSDDGVVWDVPQPGRHHDVIRKMVVMGYPTPIDGEQGFRTTKGRFVGREEAKTIAIQRGQLLPPRVNGYVGPELFSEDLW